LDATSIKKPKVQFTAIFLMEFATGKRGLA